MKRLSITVTLTLVLVIFSAAAQDATISQSWTARDGRVMLAKFTSLEGESVVIEKDGKQLVVALAKLAPASVEQAKKLGAEAEAVEADLGAKVMRFCQSSLGQKVGDGQCAALDVNALAAAGAAGMARKHSPGTGDYVWGRQVALIEGGRKSVQGLETLARVKPGDMIQFRDARMEGPTRDGRRGTYWYRFDHHSAVVNEVDAAQGILKVFHQNTNGKQFIVQDTFHLADLVKGWLRIYRPQLAKK